MENNKYSLKTKSGEVIKSLYAQDYQLAVIKFSIIKNLEPTKLTKIYDVTISN